MKKWLIALAAVALVTQTARAQGVGTLIVSVHGEDGPVAQAAVQVGSVTRMTGADGMVTLSLPPGLVDVVVTRTGFDPGAAQVQIRAGMESRVDVALEPRSELEENVIVSATRSEQRIEDVPLRVEVVPDEEVQEKIAMAPGDVSMLLAETNGLRVQTTSPSLGGASLRIQGLSGRYAQVLSDGLPLYGAQSGSVGILQIPPMDLAQVEVIKGVASALYGMSAIGGVVNLVSRRPKAGAPEHEVLVNRTTHRGTDGALWLAQPVNEHWGYSVLGGAHWQDRSDLDHDGWTDLPMFRRTQVRPRVSWDDGGGRSVFATMGALTEDRRGGTMPGATTPDGQPHPENLQTKQFDGGFVARFLTSKKIVAAIRGSGVSQRHDHAYGSAIERDRSGTLFGEASVTGTTGHNTWVGGAAFERDTFRSIDVPRFDYSYTIPGVFAQDDYAIARWLTASASARVDRHSAFGTFFSPRLSLLFRPTSRWTARVSGGRGHFAPSPFTEETDATGLAPLAPLVAIEPESARSVSADVTWRKVPFEITTTVFHSRISGAQVFRQLPDGPFAARIVNAETPTRTSGTEFIARYHTEDVDVIVTHMYLSSSEVGENGTGRRDVPLNPRQTASFDLLWETGPAHFGFEVFYTGRQALEDDPYRSRSSPYVLWGILYTHRVGPALLYVNTEDLGDVRQTKSEPLLRPARLRDGRWSTDAWAPLDGRTLNAGLRFRF
jgi:outer membrane receptor for ferrienterochelin and colicins